MKMGLKKKVKVTAKSTVFVCVCDSVMPNSLQPHGLQPTRLLYPWDSPVKNTGVGCHALLQGSNQHLYLSCLGRWLLYLALPGKPTYVLIFTKSYIRKSKQKTVKMLT